MQRFWRLFLAVSLLVASVAAQFGFPGPQGPEAKPVKSDIKYIKCEVCQLVAKQGYRQVKAAEKALKAGKKLKEFDVIELVEKLSNPTKDEGEWITFLDLDESDDGRLLVKEMGEPGKCGTECKTIQRAAEEIIDSADTDIAEKLWQGKASRSQFTNWLCNEVTTSCKTKPPKLPADRPEGPPFKAVSPDEARMDKMMASMKEMGMGGQMFSRDQASRIAEGGEADDYEDYSDDSNDSIVTPEDIDGAKNDDVEGSIPNLAEKVAETAQVGVDAALQAANKGWETAKEAGKNLLSMMGMDKEGDAKSAGPSESTKTSETTESGATTSTSTTDEEL